MEAAKKKKWKASLSLELSLDNYPGLAVRYLFS
jgi:hypothetical protein